MLANGSFNLNNTIGYDHATTTWDGKRFAKFFSDAGGEFNLTLAYLSSGTIKNSYTTGGGAGPRIIEIMEPQTDKIIWHAPIYQDWACGVRPFVYF